MPATDRGGAVAGAAAGSARGAVSGAAPGAAPGSVTRRSADGRLTIGLIVALVATMVPLLRVIDSGPWTLSAGVVAVAVLGAGYGARWLLQSAVAATLIELAVWIAVVTAMFFGSTAIAAVIPTGATLGEVPALIAGAAEDIQLGVAPLTADRSLSFVLVASVGLLALVLDHVVLTARMPLLAAVALVAVWLIPALAVPAPVDIVSFVFLAAAILFVIRAETRAREASARAGTRSFLTGRAARGVATMSAGIATIAIVVAVVATPVLPQPAGAGAGFGVGTSIDPSLALGDDLRRPREIPVLTVRTDAPAAPYLRVATLSRFDGDIWEPADSPTVPLHESGALPELDVGSGISVAEQHTTVDIAYLSSAWLPVPFPATTVEGLTGQWRVAPADRTVIGANGGTRGQLYQVVTRVPQPTLEQIRSSRATGPADGAAGADDEARTVPPDVPSVVAATAAEVTAGTGSDYDALIALQDWFRGPQFRYSLDAPVSDGFDGSGAEAIAAFLQVREGYCVHFAAAFALMARTLGMPARVVVGYLPGTPTDDEVDGERVAQVTSGQSHAWPEVYFEGIGWVPFEPTKSLGTPTAFAPASESAGGSGELGQTPDAGEPTPTPTAPTPLPSERPDIDAGGGPVDAGARDPVPVLLSVLAGLVVLMLPGLAGAGRRWRQRSLARQGRAGTAWRYVQDAAIDAGIDVPASESPRAFGARLVAQHGAPEAAMATLVRAVERASYAPVVVPDARGECRPRGEHRPRGERRPRDPVAEAAVRVRSELLAVLPAASRWRARLLPRSLVVRPGGAPVGRAGR